MLNFFKLKEGFFGVFIIISLAVGLFFLIGQLAVYLDTNFSRKAFATESQTVTYNIEKDGKVFTKTYTLTVKVDEEGTFYQTDLTSEGKNVNE